MRVLHLGKYFPPSAGGIERFLAELLTEQCRAGLDAGALVHRQRGQVATLPANVEAVAALGELLFVPISPTWPWHLLRRLQRAPPDLLHIHLPNPWAFCLLALPAARRLPWLLHWHADVPADTEHRGLRLAYPWYARLESALLRRARLIVATSAAYLAASPPLQPHLDRCRVVPLGLGAAAPPGHCPPWPAPGLRVLAIGRLSFYKGFPTLIDALARYPDSSLLLIGEGEQRPAIEARVRQLGLSERVRLTGQVDDASLSAALLGCDVLCLPSLDRAEAFGLVLLEAMRAGKPVIASAVPGSGISEVVGDPPAGLLVPPQDADALAAALARLHADADQRRRLGELGQRRFAEQFGIQQVTTALTTIYHELLAAAPATAPATPP